MSKLNRTLIAVALIVASGATIVVLRIRQHDKDIAWALYADMHNIATSQAAYYNDNSSFATDLSDRYQPTHGASVRITAASETSWVAVATHPQTKKVCTISYAEPRHATESQVGAARVAAMTGYTCK